MNHSMQSGQYAERRIFMRSKRERETLIKLGRYLFEDAEVEQYENLSNLYHFLYDGASLMDDMFHYKKLKNIK